MPYSHLCRKAFEQSIASVLDGKEPALAFCPFVPFTGFQPPHQANFRSIRKRYLLMPAADAKDRLACTLDDFKHACQRFGRILVPGVTLSAKNYVRGSQTANAFE